MLPPRDLALRIGSAHVVEADTRLSDQLRLVLETQPGTLPWRPDFGCDLDRFVGNPMTDSWKRDVEATVRRALERWVPAVRVRGIELRVLTSAGVRAAGSFRALPLAEASVVPYGSDAALEIQLDLETPRGRESVQLNVSP